MFGLINCIFQTPTWFLVALERMPVSHHDQILVLLQVGAPGEVGSVRILSGAQSPGSRAGTLRAEAQEENPEAALDMLSPVTQGPGFYR